MIINSSGPRGSGRTTQQIKNAKPNAVFVWPASYSLFLPREIARKAGRRDIEILTFHCAITSYFLKGRRYSEIILDHSIELDPPVIVVDDNGNPIYGDNNEFQWSISREQATYNHLVAYSYPQKEPA